MTFQQSIGVCFTKYGEFNGTASRAEYWWFVLFVLLGASAASALNPSYGSVFCIVTFLPLLAAGSRRLHDTGISGWLQLIGLVPVAGGVVLAVFLAQPTKAPATTAELASP